MCTELSSHRFLASTQEADLEMLKSAREYYLEAVRVEIGHRESELMEARSQVEAMQKSVALLEVGIFVSTYTVAMPMNG